jgi:signal transduction histidine kinase
MATRARWVVAESGFARRAGVGFGLVTLITAVTAVGTGLFAREDGEKREHALETYADDLALGFRAELAAEKMVAIGRGYLLVAEPALLDRLGAAEQELDRALQALERPRLSARETELLADVRGSAARYREIFDRAPAASTDEARASFQEQLALRRRDLGTRLAELVDHKRRVQIDARRSARRMAERTLVLILLSSAIAVACSVVLAWRFIQHLAAIYRREQETAERARQASAAREELLSVVAHDLRNPLNAISMKARSIARHEGDPRTGERAESIQRLAASMNGLIGTLLEAARIEAGRLSLASRRCAVADLFAAAADTFAGLANQKGVHLEVAPFPRELAVWGDPDRIAQVLSNLIGNALRFTPTGGTIGIRALAAGLNVRFEVRDTGAGIAAEHLPRVFDRFWRVEGDSRKGTGLGLYIVKGIVVAHGGRIDVESRVGTGTAFVFEIPAVPPALRDGAAALEAWPAPC